MSGLACDREFTGVLDGRDFRVVVEWMTPVRDRGDWRCDWIVHWPVQPENRYSFGVDSLQALLHATEMAKATLTSSAYHISWFGMETLGLPCIPPLAGDVIDA